MFKRSEESEWTRFSKALGNKDQPRGREDRPEPEPEMLEPDSGTASTSASAEAGPPPATMAPARPAGDAEASQDPASVAEMATLDPTGTTQPAASGMAPRSLAQEGGESLIGEGTTVDGTFRSEHSIRIRGNVKGEVESERRVVVEAEARVDAKITAQQIMVTGQVNGELHCPGRVEITPTGRVTGQITAGTLIMQDGAFFEGQLSMGGRTQESEADTRRTNVPPGVSRLTGS